MKNYCFRTIKRGRLAVCAAVILAFCIAPGAAGSQPASEDDNTYSWHAELVSVDEAARKLTLQARILNYAEVADLPSFSAGDQISLTWSGANKRASGIRALKPDLGTWTDPFTMPVEFVSTELEDRYLNFRVSVPAEGLAAIESLEPGQWVTLTTVQEPRSPSDVVVGVRPYNS